MLAEVFSFGIAWGVGSVLFGLALDRVGQSLTFAIVLALASSLGSIIPLLAFNTSDAATAEVSPLPSTHAPPHRCSHPM